MPKQLFGKGNQAAKKTTDKDKRITQYTLKKFSWDVRKICEEMGFNPFEKLIQIATDTKCSKKLQLKAASDLACYVAPKLKQVEIKSDENSMFNIYFNTIPKPAPETIEGEVK